MVTDEGRDWSCWRHRPGTSSAVIVGAALALLGGCGFGAHGCHLIGYESAVVAMTLSADVQLVSFCLDDTCAPVDQVDNGSDRDPTASATVKVADMPATYRYRLTVAVGGQPAQEIDGAVTTKPFEVNGPGCGPKTANAELRVSADGTVEVTYPG